MYQLSLTDFARLQDVTKVDLPGTVLTVVGPSSPAPGSSLDHAFNLTGLPAGPAPADQGIVGGWTSSKLPTVRQ